MSEYDQVKRGKLILKGDKPKAKKRKHKKHHKDKTESSKVDEDCVKHGGWWKVEKIEDITGCLAIEFGQNTYISALDNGLFTLGAPHDEGDGPSPEEIFTAFPAGENKFALKSGYGKYLGVTKDGVVVGRADAVGPMEQWEAVWQNGNTAILSTLGKFVSVQSDDDSIVAENKTAAENEFCTIRSQATREIDTSALIPEEEKGDLQEVEVNYVKKFQKFQDKKLRVNTGDATELKRAKFEGTLHETLLDRRSKMKADRYSKKAKEPVAQAVTDGKRQLIANCGRLNMPIQPQRTASEADQIFGDLVRVLIRSQPTSRDIAYYMDILTNIDGLKNNK